MKVKNKNIPHPPQRMNILGRKRYSENAGITDVINYSFDDCWRAIARLWVAVVVLACVCYCKMDSIKS